MNNKLLAVLLATALLLSLTACRQNRREANIPTESGENVSRGEAQTEPPADPSSPEGALIALLDAAKHWDTEAIDRCLPGEATVSTHVPQPLQETLREALERMEYTVVHTQVQDSIALVALEVTAVDAQSAANTMTGAVVAHIAKQKLTGREAGDYTAILKVAADAVKIAELPLRTSAVTAHMVRDGGGRWRLDLADSENLALLNAASGGALELLDRVRALAEDYGVTLRP